MRLTITEPTCRLSSDDLSAAALRPRDQDQRLGRTGASYPLSVPSVTRFVPGKASAISRAASRLTSISVWSIARKASAIYSSRSSYIIEPYPRRPSPRDRTIRTTVEQRIPAAYAEIAFIDEHLRNDYILGLSSSFLIRRA